MCERKVRRWGADWFEGKYEEDEEHYCKVEREEEEREGVRVQGALKAGMKKEKC